MNETVDPSKTRSRTRDVSITGPLLLWMLIQCAALLIAAARVPLAARVEQPIERLAVHEMIVVQIIALAILFPILLRDWRASLAVIATGWPFIQLAAILAPVEPSHWMTAALCVSMWAVALGCWRSILRSSAAQLIGVAVAEIVAIGGVGIWYLRGEFAHIDPLVSWPRDAMFGPIMAALAQLDTPRTILTFLIPASLMVLSAGVWWLTVVRRPIRERSPEL